MASTLCSVCGDLATSYCHYGARVCHSCRTFFRRTGLMVEKGKMKRALFCCLRGGQCTVDVNNRKKCNFCRFEKCKLKGMVGDFKEIKTDVEVIFNNTKPINNTKDVNKEKSETVQFPKTLSFQFGPDEVGRIIFFVDLYRIQKVVQPIGLANIIPLVECSNNRKPFPPTIVKTHIKIHEHWWSQFCNGLEEFQGLNHEEKKIVLKNAPLADRLCQGLYLGPGAGKNLCGIIKGWTSDKKELQVVENYLAEGTISSSATFEYQQWRTSPWNKYPESEKQHLVLNREIVTWGQKGVDDVSELLACLLILFSQEHEGQFSSRIRKLYDCWRFILWRYLDCQDLVQDTKQQLFHGALHMVGITKQIWRIEQTSLD